MHTSVNVLKSLNYTHLTTVKTVDFMLIYFATIKKKKGINTGPRAMRMDFKRDS